MLLNRLPWQQHPFFNFEYLNTLCYIQNCKINSFRRVNTISCKFHLHLYMSITEARGWWVTFTFSDQDCLPSVSFLLVFVCCVSYWGQYHTVSIIFSQNNFMFFVITIYVSPTLFNLWTVFVMWFSWHQNLLRVRMQQEWNVLLSITFISNLSWSVNHIN